MFIERQAIKFQSDATLLPSSKIRASAGLKPVALNLASLNLVGESVVFQDTLRRIERVSKTNAAVLIGGETGTGKELAARAIHYLGARSSYPFVPVNCGALPDTLIENELFGHQRGAFTGATGDCPGLLKLAHGGTLFLDEVDSLPLKAQVSLLRFLQDRRFRPLGGHREEEADVRIIAASNRDLAAAIRDGQFRADLYYRLKLISIDLPPLRTREGDILLLAEHFIRACAKTYSMPAKKVHCNSMAWLTNYRWPGNVRELENLVHSEFLMSDNEVLSFGTSQMSDIDLHDTWTGSNNQSELPQYASAKARALEEFDRHYLTQLLKNTGGNVTKAAKLAGKERRALGKLIKRYNIMMGHDLS